MDRDSKDILIKFLSISLFLFSIRRETWGLIAGAICLLLIMMITTVIPNAKENQYYEKRD